MSEVAASEDRQTGRVLMFDVNRGIGWIQPDSGGDKLYVHFSHVVKRSAGEFVELLRGQRVSFLVTRGHKFGHQASDVERLD